MSASHSGDTLQGDISRLQVSKDSRLRNEDQDLFKERIRANHRARDITDEFTTASQGLKTGELVKEESFTLWDSIQALELMDPKMDSGFVPAGEPFDTGFDVNQNLLPAEVVYIMDQILGCEMAWQRGFAIFQTLFTSCHIHHLLTQQRAPKTLPDFGLQELDELSDDQMWLHLCLRAFCINTIIQCDMVIEIVASQQFYEEEDLNTQTYQIELLADISDDMSIGLLDTAIAWVQDRQNSEIGEAVLHRLQLRRATMLRSILDPESMPLDALSKLIKLIKGSQHLPNPIKAAFNPKMYRKLSISGPTRESEILPLDDACTDLLNLLGSVVEQHRRLASDSDSVMHHPESLRDFLWHLAFRPVPQSTLARAILQARLFAPDCPLGQPDGVRLYMLRETSTLQVLPDEITEGFWPSEDVAPSHPRVQIAGILHDWAEKYQGVYLDVLRALCQNPCRIRRCLVNALGTLNTLTTAEEIPVPVPGPSQNNPSSPSTSTATSSLSSSLQSFSLTNDTPITTLTTHLLSLKTTQYTTYLHLQTTHLLLSHALHSPHELPDLYARLSTLYTHLRITTTHTSNLRTSCTTNKSFLSLAVPRAAYMDTIPHRHATLGAREKHHRAMAAASAAFGRVYAALLGSGLTSRGPGSSEVRRRQREVRARDWGAGVGGEEVAASYYPLDEHNDDDTEMKPPSLSSMKSNLTLAGTELDAARTELQQMLDTKHGGPLWEAGGGGLHGGKRRWVEDAKTVLRAVVEMKIVVLRRLLELLGDGEGDGDGEEISKRVKVVLPETKGGAWGCWIVPKLQVVDAA